ncbi:hypothetical protein QBC35DRAFT_545090 [Podospora australis]|uniref:Uncharacterized protein n=1 Tax=Podospora australis TaxID=1536484 RepID=A0AAN6WKL2_9PEZI|nr:hypothetical protein QBC35DRAFT_545090 [Podospora australis]
MSFAFYQAVTGRTLTDSDPQESTSSPPGPHYMHGARRLFGGIPKEPVCDKMFDKISAVTREFKDRYGKQSSGADQPSLKQGFDASLAEVRSFAIEIQELKSALADAESRCVQKDAQLVAKKNLALAARSELARARALQIRTQKQLDESQSQTRRMDKQLYDALAKTQVLHQQLKNNEGHLEALRAIKDADDKAHQKALSEAQAEIASLKKASQVEKEKHAAVLREEHQRHLQVMADVKKGFQEEIRRKDEKHAAELEQVYQLHLQFVSDLEQGFQAEIKRKDENHAAEWEQGYQLHLQVVSDLEQGFQAKIQRKDEMVTSTIAQIADHHGEEVKSLKTKITELTHKSEKQEQRLDWTRSHADYRRRELLTVQEELRRERNERASVLKRWATSRFSWKCKVIALAWEHHFSLPPEFLPFPTLNGEAPITVDQLVWQGCFEITRESLAHTHDALDECPESDGFREYFNNLLEGTFDSALLEEVFGEEATKYAQQLDWIRDVLKYHLTRLPPAENSSEKEEERHDDEEIEHLCSDKDSGFVDCGDEDSESKVYAEDDEETTDEEIEEVSRLETDEVPTVNEASERAGFDSEDDTEDDSDYEVMKDVLAVTKPAATAASKPFSAIPKTWCSIFPATNH